MPDLLRQPLDESGREELHHDGAGGLGDGVRLQGVLSLSAQVQGDLPYRSRFVEVLGEQAGSVRKTCKINPFTAGIQHQGEGQEGQVQR